MALIKSSLVKKYWMAATGLFLCLFLVGHLAGNLQLLISPENGAKDTFNLYAKFMTTNPLVKILSYLTYFSILFHAIDGIILTIENRKARPVQYVYNNPAANSIWSSRNMGILGTVILVFIVTHMSQFWAKMHWGPIEMYDYNGEQLKDLYTITIAQFQDESMGLIWVLAYVIAMIAVAFHLVHGFQSAFQSVGIRHKKYTPVIEKIGLGFAVIVPFLFAIIPVYIRFMK
jgi:succinate dehydrogenase / fumarate reductase, cytochrome b subunit